MFGTVYWSTIITLLIVIIGGLYISISGNTLCITPLSGGISAGVSIFLFIIVNILAASPKAK